MKEIMEKVIKNEDLSENEMIIVMEELMNGNLSEAVGGAFLTALRMKGETINEITGGAKVMRRKSERVELSDLYTVDTCGTGGDQTGTFNISTATSFICAAAGIYTAKHGNRSVSSKSGSADVLEALGVDIELSPKQVEICIKNHHIGFFFAPLFHPAMKYAAPIRKALGYPTIFNMLGPLTNPAQVDAQIIGVYDKKLAIVFANVLRNLGTEHALIVHGLDGLDELTTTTSTQIVELKNGDITTYHIHPEDFGLKLSQPEDLLGGGSYENAQIIREIFNGELGPKRDIVLLNAGAALYLGKKVSSIKEGVKLAGQLIDQGLVKAKMESYIEFTQGLGRENLKERCV
ncbi:MAG TPA: anthranilate phosphoribosyltransferase [Epulopiscium sp.]|nr:anthranilate phosphoribosyltransferase [Candidatus Epulonipiscium sp.]